MSPTSIALPRGLVAGTFFACLLAAPLFFAISLDSVTPSLSSGFRFGSASYARPPRPMSSSAEFFGRKVAVQVSVGFRPVASSNATPRTPSFFGPVGTGGPRAKSKKMFQVRVENRSDEDLSIDVLKAKSEVGDLTAGLQSFRLAPGQMTQTSVAVQEASITNKPLPVEVTLRLNGSEEKHELVLTPFTSP